MTEAEVSGSYELSTGTVIAETFRGRSADPRRAASSASNGESAHRQSGAAGFWHIHPDEVPSVLVANHGPFSWGPSAAKAVENAVVLEEVARMALHTELISKIVEEAPRYLSDKHFLRKHGANAYYGQGLT
jgi:ribulose-5-phosphate 4-epimerase/fuculose-1-phosphate aldolase